MKDFSHRQGRNLPDGMGAVSYKLLKPVRVLGAKYKFNADGTELSCEGEPNSASGFLTISLDEAKNATVDYDVDAATLETILAQLLTDLDLEGEVECTGGPLPATPIAITMPHSRRLKVKYGLIKGGEWVGFDDNAIPCTVLDEEGEPTVDTIEVRSLTPHWAYRIGCQAFKKGDQWFISPEKNERYGVAAEDLDGASPHTDTYGAAGLLNVFSNADEPEGRNTEVLQILDGEHIVAWPYAGKWLVKLKYPKTILIARATEDMTEGTPGAFQIQDSVPSFPLSLSDTAHDEISAIPLADMLEDDLALLSLVNGKWWEASPRFCPVPE